MLYECEGMHMPVERSYLHQLWHKITARLRSLPQAEAGPPPEVQKVVLSEQSLPLTAVEALSVEQWLTELDHLCCKTTHFQQSLQTHKSSYKNMSKTVKEVAQFNVMLGALKEHWLNYEYRREQFREAPECYQKNEFVNIDILSRVIYEELLRNISYFSDHEQLEAIPKDLRKLWEELTKHIDSLSHLMVALNRFAYRQEALMQIAELERSLLCSLYRNELMVLTEEDTKALFQDSISVEVHEEDWLFKLNRIHETEHVVLIQNIIEIYQMLSNCYIISRRSVVNATLEDMHKNLDSLTGCFFKNQISNKEVMHYLRSIYQQIESLRFSANRDSRCSRNLLERSKDARKLFLHACQQNSIASEFLSSLVNPVKAFKSRR